MCIVTRADMCQGRSRDTYTCMYVTIASRVFISLSDYIGVENPSYHCTMLSTIEDPIVIVSHDTNSRLTHGYSKYQVYIT